LEQNRHGKKITMVDEASLKKIKAELLNGLESQKAGNQGRARVCARRAAGWAIQEYLEKQEQPLPSTIALNLIKHFSTLDGHSTQMTEVLQHLLLRVQKDSFEEEAYYPIEGVDLVAEAHWLVEELLEEKFPLE
jgi:hypothetical protein